IDGFWLACPYDTATLPDAVLAEARRSHPHVANDTDGAVSVIYPGLDEFSKPFAVPLPEAPLGAETVIVSMESLRDVRALAMQRARAAQFDEMRENDFVFVANELATNSVRHGGGHGVFRIWDEGHTLVCEMRDAGRIAH